MTVRLGWVRLPSAWITEGGLRRFSWRKGRNSAETAALMTLIALAHRTDQETGVAKVTYDELTEAISVSRTVLADALELLASRGRIQRDVAGRSTFGLADFSADEGWAMLPAKRLYHAGQIIAFRDFHLRKVEELDALKVYLLVVAGRDRKRNRTFMNYDQITERSGVPSNRIRTALSILALNHLVHVELTDRESIGVTQSYRLPQIEPRQHGGTVGRQEVSEGMFDE